jgi:hypothetical protein
MARLPRTASVDVVSEATPEQVWDLLADITRSGEWSHEARGGEWLGGATHAVAGARFRGRNRAGRMRWARTCEVVAAERPHVLSWRTLPTWRYRDSSLWHVGIEPVEGGSRITQRYEVLRLPAFFDWLFALLIPAHRDRTEALRGDLAALGAVAAGRAASRDAA